MLIAFPSRKLIISSTVMCTQIFSLSLSLFLFHSFFPSFYPVPSLYVSRSSAGAALAYAISEASVSVAALWRSRNTWRARRISIDLSILAKGTVSGIESTGVIYFYSALRTRVFRSLVGKLISRSVGRIRCFYAQSWVHRN